jgi:hypothetical protein
MHTLLCASCDLIYNYLGTECVFQGKVPNNLKHFQTFYDHIKHHGFLLIDLMDFLLIGRFNEK